MSCRGEKNESQIKWLPMKLIRERKKSLRIFFNNVTLLMFHLDVPYPGSQESIAPNRFSKFDREHAFFSELRFLSPWDYL